jgi:putative nucleotidyltransferase with HDIG domain
MARRVFNSIYAKLTLIFVVVLSAALFTFYFGVSHYLKVRAEKEFIKICKLETRFLFSNSVILLKNYDYTQLYEFLNSSLKEDKKLKCVGIYQGSAPLIELGNCKKLNICEKELSKNCYFEVTVPAYSNLLLFKAYFSTQKLMSFLASIRRFGLGIFLTVFVVYLSVLVGVFLKVEKEVFQITEAIDNWRKGALKELKGKRWNNEFDRIVREVVFMYEELEEERQIDNKLLLFTGELLNLVSVSKDKSDFLEGVSSILRSVFRSDWKISYDEEKKELKVEVSNSGNLPGSVVQTVKNIVLSGLSVVENKERLEETLIGVVRALANAIDAMSKWTRGHSDRVAEISVALGKQLGLSEDKLEVLEIGALLHDIGKLGVPKEILDKKGKLTSEEYETIKKHPGIGYEILKPVKELSQVLPIVLYHHERCDGSGYPEGLHCSDIPFLAKIVAVADVLEAMTADRPYKKGRPFDYVVSYLAENSGKLFDEEVIKALLSAKEEIRKIIENSGLKYETSG